jgi:hypothetical protein
MAAGEVIGDRKYRSSITLIFCGFVTNDFLSPGTTGHPPVWQQVHLTINRRNQWLETAEHYKSAAKSDPAAAVEHRGEPTTQKDKEHSKNAQQHSECSATQ